jgi:hypothetical protein
MLKFYHRLYGGKRLVLKSAVNAYHWYSQSRVALQVDVLAC